MENLEKQRIKQYQALNIDEIAEKMMDIILENHINSEAIPAVMAVLDYKIKCLISS